MTHLNLLQVNSWLWMAWALYWVAASRAVQRTEAAEAFSKRLSHLLPVALGFVLIFSPPTIGLECHEWGAEFWLEVAGISVTALGLFFAVWSRVHLGKYWSGTITLKEGHKLIRTGPYRLARHPLYTGFLFGLAGSALTAQTIEAGLGFVLVTVSYLIKIRREEIFLTRQFGEEYALFRREVKALIPFIY